jgi:hypothetical protein
MDHAGGRSGTRPFLVSNDTYTRRASELQHAVQDVGGNRYLGHLTSDRLRAQRLIDHPLPATDVGFYQSTPVLPGGFLPGHAATRGNQLQMPVSCVGAVSAVSLGTALERGGTITAASGWR